MAADAEQPPQPAKRRRVAADSAAPDLGGLNPTVARAMAGGDAATDAAVGRLAAAFRGRTDCDERAAVGIAVHGTPFPTCTIDGLLTPALLDRVQVRRNTLASEPRWRPSLTVGSVPRFLGHAGAQTELLALPRQPKSNDLYHFEQTPDLVNVTVRRAPGAPRTCVGPGLTRVVAASGVCPSQSPALTQLRESLYSEAFVGLIGKLAGVALNRQMDMSGHRYPPAVRRRRPSAGAGAAVR